MTLKGRARSVEAVLWNLAAFILCAGAVPHAGVKAGGAVLHSVWDAAAAPRAAHACRAAAYLRESADRPLQGCEDRSGVGELG